MTLNEARRLNYHNVDAVCILVLNINITPDTKKIIYCTINKRFLGGAFLLPLSIYIILGNTNFGKKLAGDGVKIENLNW